MNSKRSLVVILISQVCVLNFIFAKGNGVDRGGGLACREHDQVRLCELTHKLPACSEWSDYDQMLSKIPKPVNQKFLDLLQIAKKHQPEVVLHFQDSRKHFKFCTLNGDLNSLGRFPDKNPFLREDWDIILDWQVVLSSPPEDVALFLLKTLVPTHLDLGDLEVADD